MSAEEMARVLRALTERVEQLEQQLADERQERIAGDKRVMRDVQDREWRAA